MIKAITSLGLMFITFKFAIVHVPYFWALVSAFFVVIVFRATWNGIFNPRPKPQSCNCKGK